jgi:hypothetical protein
MLSSFFSMSGFFFMMPSTLALHYLVTSLDGWCDGQAFNQQQDWLVFVKELDLVG